MRLTDSVILVTLFLSSSAQAASLNDKVEKLLNNGDLEEARTLCTKENASASQDALLRELCGEAFLDEVETTNTIERWQKFRENWADTKWEIEALSREANLALTHLGYDADEVEYLKMSKQYKGTPEAKLAKERAAQIDHIVRVPS